MTTPILVDRDMALDDWMALSWLLMSPEADVRAITVAVCFWDPLAAVLSTHPDLGRYQTRAVRVVEGEGAECERVVDDPAGVEVRVGTGVDQGAFEDVFLDELHGVARRARRARAARASEPS